MSEPQAGVPNGAPPHSASPILWLIVVAIIVNTLGLVYGFRQLALFSETLRWTTTANLAATAAASADTLLGETTANPNQLVVDIFTDYECQACRASVPAVEAAREHFGDRIEWRYHHLTRPRTNTPGFKAALLSICAFPGSAPWPLYRSMSQDSQFSDALFEKRFRAALEAENVSASAAEECAQERFTRESLWNDLFLAASVGIQSTPALIVRGQRITGRLEPAMLKDFLAAQFTAIQTIPPLSR